MFHRVLIVDDNALIRRSVRSLIETNTDCEVCGEAENGKVAIEKVLLLKPDVIILDWQMPIMNGLEAAQQISQIAPSATMLMFTMHDCEKVEPIAHAAGVRDVFSKFDRVAEHLMTALQN